jgi:hypothetical protein
MSNAYKYNQNADELVNQLYQRGLINQDGTSALVQTLIDDYLEIESNQFFWQEHFTIDGAKYNLDLSRPKADPAYTIYNITRRPVPMADAMAPLSEVAQMDNEGWEQRTGTIPQYGKGLFDTSLSREELKARLNELSADNQTLLAGYVRGVGDLIKTHNYRISNMAAQVMSNGGAYSNADSKGQTGIIHQFPKYVPAANFVKAGADVWSNASADVPSQMQKIEKDFRDRTGFEGPMEWDLPYDMVMSLLNNAAFKKEVNRFLRLYAPDKVVVITNGASDLDAQVISWEQLVAYTRSSVSKISPIRIVKEEQTVQTITTISTVKGWKKNVAVLRPLGMAGKVVHSDVADVILLQREANKTIDYSIATAQNSLLYVINKTVPNGLYKAYHTDVIGRYMPVLTEFMEHVIVDTETAES